MQLAKQAIGDAYVAGSFEEGSRGRPVNRPVAPSTFKMSKNSLGAKKNPVLISH